MRRQGSMRGNQDGFVAIIACMTVITILAVITTGFARLMQREQRQALDRQLSSQAFYAAESGVNYAVKNEITDKSECETANVEPLDNDDAGVVSFPCLLVDSEPEELVYSDINTERPVIFNITTPVNRLDIAWQSPDPTNNSFAGDDLNFPPQSAWRNGAQGRVGVVELTVYPINGNNVNTNTLFNSARTFYLYPSGFGGTGVATASFNNDAQIIRGHCHADNEPKKCRVRINNVPSVTGYVVRLRSIYNSVSLQMNGFTGGTAREMTGAQRLIDATGRAGDVLTRVQVRLPLQSSYDSPLHVIETADNLCKLLQTEPTNSNSTCPPPSTPTPDTGPPPDDD